MDFFTCDLCLGLASSIAVMFSSWPAHPTAGGSGAAWSNVCVDSGERSRSPASAGVAFTGQTGTAAAVPAIAAASPCTTGNAVADAWFDHNVTDHEVRDGFSELPMFKRKGIVLKCMDRPPDNANSWIYACVKNHQLGVLEKRLTGGASVHNAPCPVPKVSNGSWGPNGLAGAQPSYGAPHASAGGCGTARPPGRGGTMAAPSQVESTTPIWSTRLYGYWPAKKSQLLGEFFAMLSPAVAARVQILPPQTQASLAFGYILAAPADTTKAEEMVTSWLDRVDILELRGPGAMVSLKPDNMTTFVLSLQVIVSGGSVAPAVLSVFLLPKVMEQLRSDLVMSLLPTIYIPDDDPGGLTASLLTTKLGGMQVNADVHSFDALLHFFENNMQQFVATNTKFIFVNTLGCATVSDTSQTRPATSVLHGNAARWVWTATKASAMLRNGIGDSNVAELTFAPTHVHHEVAVSLSALFGSPVSTQNMMSEYNKVANVPLVFSIPSGCSVSKCCRNSSCGDLVLDGWNLRAQPESRWENARPGVATVLSTALSVQLFQERSLTDTESQVVHALRIVHSSTGETRHCSREWFYRWWGFLNSPLPKFWDETKPCGRMIVAVTGLPATPGMLTASPCGKERFCRTCEDVHQLIDGGYHLFTVVDSMASVLNKALRTWKDGVRDDAWGRDAAADRTHVCGPDCSHHAVHGQ